VTDLHNPQLAAWESFYVIVGSSGAALIGLQFVVITLIADKHNRATSESISAFGTPTVVHFAVALVVSAIMSAPWQTLIPTAIALGICGLFGVVYAIVVVQRARRQTDYTPVAEDWAWYAIVPCTIYAVLSVGAFFVRSGSQTALDVVGGVALSLLLLGIHNAWDTVIHIGITSAQKD
jgi:hypothetical protein